MFRLWLVGLSLVLLAGPQTTPGDPMQAVKEGKIAVVRELLAANPSLAGEMVELGGGFRGTLLLVAAVNGRREVAELLIEKGADVNAAMTKSNVTPLHAAAQYGHTSIAELLIAKGAHVNAKTITDSTPLHEAAEGGHTGVAELLIGKGAEVDATDFVSQTPLHLAASKGRKQAAALLIAKGASVTAKDHIGKTPIDVAKDSETADYLRACAAKKR
jgi:ankyrin repeat protein